MIPADRVLVLRALGLGDLLAGVPAMRSLRRTLPGAHVTLAAPDVLRPLVELAGVADAVVDTRGPVTPCWTGAPPDVAVDLHGRGPQSHRALEALHPHRLVAFDCPPAGHGGPAWHADEHERVRWCRLVAETLGGEPDPDDLHLPRPGVAAAVPGAVVVHPGAASASRRWPLDRYAAVARWSARAGHDVVVTGGPDEVDLARQLAVDAGLPPSAVLAGRTDLLDVAALVCEARLVVCGDTGVAHLASAFATPSVVLFGPVAPRLWGPPVDGPHVVLWKGDGRGDPHGDSVDPSLAAIGAEEVIEAMRSLPPSLPPSWPPVAGVPPRRTTRASC
jgi:ADP-heptose:LPS heptosyltransferase